jgi:alkaline phosphatase D
VVATGDIHTSWAINLENNSYPVGVEFVTPSVTSPGIPINAGSFLTLENPHLKYVELTKKGFVILDISTEKVQGDWYYMNTIDEQSSANSCQKSYFTNSGSNTLVSTTTPSVGHGSFGTGLVDPCNRFAAVSDLSAHVVGIYPNPSVNYMYVQLFTKEPLKWRLIAKNGTEVDFAPVGEKTDHNGISTLIFDVSGLSGGMYTLMFESSKQVKTVSFIKH